MHMLVASSTNIDRVFLSCSHAGRSPSDIGKPGARKEQTKVCNFFSCY